MGRPNLRTFTWRITGGTARASSPSCPSTGELRVADQQLLDEQTTYTLKVRVSDGFHESAETDVAVVTGDLANVVDGDAGAHRAGDARRSRSAPAPASARSRRASRKDYEAVHERHRHQHGG